MAEKAESTFPQKYPALYAEGIVVASIIRDFGHHISSAFGTTERETGPVMIIQFTSPIGRFTLEMTQTDLDTT